MDIDNVATPQPRHIMTMITWLVRGFAKSMREGLIGRSGRERPAESKIIMSAPSSRPSDADVEVDYAEHNNAMNGGVRGRRDELRATAGRASYRTSILLEDGFEYDFDFFPADLRRVVTDHPSLTRKLYCVDAETCSSSLRRA